MLDVLLTEIRVRRLVVIASASDGTIDGEQRETHLDDVEELGDDRRHASEKVGSTGTFHLMTVFLDLDERALLQGDVLVYSRWIHVLDARQEHRRGRADGTRDGHLLPCQLLEILGERARIGAQVFVQCKLSGVDKDGDDRQVVFVKRSADCM